MILRGEWADARGEKLDVVGSVLYGLAILLLVYGASRLPEIRSVYFTVAGTVCLVAFIRRELSIPFPVFDVRLFSRNKVFAFSSVAALINYSATFALTFLLSLYLQYIKGIPPHHTGTILIAQPIVMAVFSPLAGRISDRIEPRLIASTGMALTALGLAFFVSIGPATPRLFIVLNSIEMRDDDVFSIKKFSGDLSGLSFQGTPHASLAGKRK